MSATITAPVDYAARVTERGYVLIYRPMESNRCPGCGGSAWLVGRVTAECGLCQTASPILTPATSVIGSVAP